jgi:hypothetical protein
MHDPVNPSHYTPDAIECIEALEASMTAEAFKGFLKGNCIKYLWRYEKKNGTEDLKKAQWYLNRLIMVSENCSMDKNGVNYDPDDYQLPKPCPDGYCPMPNIRQGPAEDIFPPA